MPDNTAVITGYEIYADDESGAVRRPENLQSQPHASSEEIVAALKDNLARENKIASNTTQFSYHSSSNTNEDIDFEALSDEKASIYGQIVEATLDFGYDLLKDRVFANRAEWREAMLDELGELDAQNGFSNANIKQVFYELWEKEYTTEKGARAAPVGSSVFSQKNLPGWKATQGGHALQPVRL